MILYNVTVKVDHAAHDEWVQWMKETHIPEVLDTGLFVEHKMCRLLEVDESDGVTYAIQYFLPSMENYGIYREEYAPALQQKHIDKFKGKFVAFRTIMEVV